MIKIRSTLWYVPYCKNFRKSGTWVGNVMRHRPGHLGMQGTCAEGLEHDAPWSLAGDQPPTCTDRGW